MANAFSTHKKLVVLFMLALALRIMCLRCIVLDVDEAWFAAAGAKMSSIADLSVKAIDNKPPGTTWFYGFIHLLFGTNADPRPARGVFIALMVFTAWLLGRCIVQIEKCRNGSQEEPLVLGLSVKGSFAALVFLLASALPTPEQLATTSEGILLPGYTFIMLTFFSTLASGQKAHTWRWLASGLILAFSVFVKQTALFFIPASFYGVYVLRKKNLVSTVQISLFTGSSLIAILLLTRTLGWEDLWYWTVLYPSTILAKARNELFDEKADALLRSAVLSLALWPLIRFLKLREILRLPRDVRHIICAWLLSAVASVIIGKALFFHYFLFLIPPLTILFSFARLKSGTKRIPAKDLLWLGFPYVFVCAISSISACGILWGADVRYYEKLGSVVKTLTKSTDTIFIWGGNALPCVTSNRLFATRFPTARFLALPYATPLTHGLFKKDFTREKPKLILDLHQRRDERFDAPIESVSWLKQELKKNYVEYREPGIPWVSIYLYQPKRLQNRIPAWQAKGNLRFQHVYRELEASFSRAPLHSAMSFLLHWKNASTLESLLRAWDGLHSLLTSDPRLGERRKICELHAKLESAIFRQIRMLRQAVPDSSESSDQTLAKDSMAWLRLEFRSRRLLPAFSLESRLWWASLALVKLQPSIGHP